MKKLKFGLLLLASVLMISCSSQENPREHLHRANIDELTQQPGIQVKDTMNTGRREKIVKTEEEWKQILTDREYRILRGGGTEFPFTNEYWDNKEDGTYYCAACGNPLFSSEHKYKSGTGWPSFWQPVDPKAVAEREDNSLFMTRTEIICARCESHIGHVFKDGPEPTGLRYCMNSAALDFEKKKADESR